jgi:hypothetical protein
VIEILIVDNLDAGSTPATSSILSFFTFCYIYMCRVTATEYTYELLMKPVIEVESVTSKLL